MRLVNDHGEGAVGHIGVAVDVGELLDGADDDARTAVQGVPQVLRGALHLHDQTFLVLHGIHVFLQLAVQHLAVGQDDDGVEHRRAIGLGQSRQLVRGPRNGVALAAARGMLDQVVAARSFGGGTRDQLAHHAQLVVAREDDGIHLVARALDLGEALHDLQQRLGLQHLREQVVGAASLFHGRIAGVAVVSLIELPELGIARAQHGCHAHQMAVHGEVDQAAVVGPEDELARVAVPLVLPHGVFHALPGLAVLQLHGDQGQAVHEQHHVQAVVHVAFHGAVAQLAYHFKAVAGMLAEGIGVQVVGRAEIAQAQPGTRHLEAMAQHMHQAVEVKVLV